MHWPGEDRQFQQLLEEREQRWRASARNSALDKLREMQQQRRRRRERRLERRRRRREREGWNSEYQDAIDNWAAEEEADVDAKEMEDLIERAKYGNSGIEALRGKKSAMFSRRRRRRRTSAFSATEGEDDEKRSREQELLDELEDRREREEADVDHEDEEAEAREEEDLDWKTVQLTKMEERILDEMLGNKRIITAPKPLDDEEDGEEWDEEDDILSGGAKRRSSSSSSSDGAPRREKLLAEALEAGLGLPPEERAALLKDREAGRQAQANQEKLLASRKRKLSRELTEQEQLEFVDRQVDSGASTAPDDVKNAVDVFEEELAEDDEDERRSLQADDLDRPMKDSITKHMSNGALIANADFLTGVLARFDEQVDNDQPERRRTLLEMEGHYTEPPLITAMGGIGQWPEGYVNMGRLPSIRDVPFCNPADTTGWYNETLAKEFCPTWSHWQDPTVHKDGQVVIPDDLPEVANMTRAEKDEKHRQYRDKVMDQINRQLDIPWYDDFDWNNDPRILKNPFNNEPFWWSAQPDPHDDIQAPDGFQRGGNTIYDPQWDEPMNG